MVWTQMAYAIVSIRLKGDFVLCKWPKTSCLMSFMKRGKFVKLVDNGTETYNEYNAYEWIAIVGLKSLKSKFLAACSVGADFDGR